MCRQLKKNMKTNKQYEDSARTLTYAFIGIVVVILLALLTGCGTVHISHNSNRCGKRSDNVRNRIFTKHYSSYNNFSADAIGSNLQNNSTLEQSRINNISNMRIITARDGYVYRRLHDGFEMGENS